MQAAVARAVQKSWREIPHLGAPLARVVALPDADWTPEMLVRERNHRSPRRRRLGVRLHPQGSEAGFQAAANLMVCFRGVKPVMYTLSPSSRGWA